MKHLLCDNEKGFSLAEIVIVLILIAIIGTGAFSTILSNQKVTTAAKNRIRANNFGRTVVDNIREKDFFKIKPTPDKVKFDSVTNFTYKISVSPRYFSVNHYIYQNVMVSVYYQDGIVDREIKMSTTKSIPDPGEINIIAEYTAKQNPTPAIPPAASDRGLGGKWLSSDDQTNYGTAYDKVKSNNPGEDLILMKDYPLSDLPLFPVSGSP